MKGCGERVSGKFYPCGYKSLAIPVVFCKNCYISENKELEKAVIMHKAEIDIKISVGNVQRKRIEELEAQVEELTITGPEFTCSDCGSKENKTEHSSGEDTDCDIVCLDCGSNDIAESPLKALVTSCRDKDDLMEKNRELNKELKETKSFHIKYLEKCQKIILMHKAEIDKLKAQAEAQKRDIQELEEKQHKLIDANNNLKERLNHSRNISDIILERSKEYVKHTVSEASRLGYTNDGYIELVKSIELYEKEFGSKEEEGK